MKFTVQSIVGKVFLIASVGATSACAGLQPAARARGGSGLDAPGSGGQSGAENGTLTVMAGGVERWQSGATTPKTPPGIEALLKSTARAFPVAQTQPNGAGIVQARAAVDAVNGTPPPPTGVPSNGTPVTGLSGAAGAEFRHTLVVPAGAPNPRLVTSGRTGRADPSAKFGRAPRPHRQMRA